jgi:hypothetical protein
MFWFLLECLFRCVESNFNIGWIISDICEIHSSCLLWYHCGFSASPVPEVVVSIMWQHRDILLYCE